MTGENGNPIPGRKWSNIKQDLAQELLDTEKPTDFIITLIYCIPILAPVRVCIETGVFLKLAQSDCPLPVEQLVPSSGVSDSDADDNQQGRIDFTQRMLRAVSSTRLVDEYAARTYCANELTHLMADPGFTAGFQLLFDNATGPRSTMSEFVSYHKANDWTAPASATDGPWQTARNANGTSTFEHWTRHDPVQLTRLSSLMQRMQGTASHWTDWFPETALFRDAAPGEAPFFVDVGGGRGHDVSALTGRYPKRAVLFVLQDLPSVIDEGAEERRRSGKELDPRIVLSKHNFFQAQPIRGAMIYYLHKIMHDWPDEDCAAILAQLRDAMTESSRILINDVVLPDRGASLLHAAFDIDMLALHSGQERDEASWRRVIEMVEGLEVREVWSSPDQREGIVEVGRRMSST